MAVLNMDIQHARQALRETRSMLDSESRTAASLRLALAQQPQPLPNMPCDRGQHRGSAWAVPSTLRLMMMMLALRIHPAAALMRSRPARTLLCG